MAEVAMAGKDILGLLQKGAVDLPPIFQTMGIDLNSFGDGWAILDMEVRKGHQNAMGYAHGGAIATLGDGVLGAALMTTLKQGELFTTLDLHTNYLRQAKSTILRAEGRVIRRGRTTAYCEAEITDSDKKIVAKVNCTCMVTKGDWEDI